MADPYDTGSTDPFTVVYGDIFDLIKANDRITSIVKTANFIRLDEGKAYANMKQRRSNADNPTIELEPAGGAYNTAQTNRSIGATQIYRLIIKSGEKSVDVDFLPLKWAVMIALTTTSDRFGHDYVGGLHVEDVADEPRVDEHPGWAFAFDIFVQFGFDKAVMQAIT